MYHFKNTLGVPCWPSNEGLCIVTGMAQITAVAPGNSTWHGCSKKKQTSKQTKKPLYTPELDTNMYPPPPWPCP